MPNRDAPRADPLAVFVHIPKTAGSALNSLLLRHYGARRSPVLWGLAEAVLPRALVQNPVGARWLARGLAGGCPHLGTYLDRPATLDRILATADWVSAHLPRPVLAERLARIGRPGRFVTVLRDPTDQVASHYQWWIEIHRRGPLRFYRYEPFFRDLSRRIRAADNADPEAIIAILRRHHSLFLNTQAHYVSSRQAPPASGLARLAAWGLDDDLGPAFATMTGAPPPPPAGRVNASAPSAIREVFRSPEMQAYLAHAHRRDFMLYDAARSGARSTRPPSSS